MLSLKIKFPLKNISYDYVNGDVEKNVIFISLTVDLSLRFKDTFKNCIIEGYFEILKIICEKKFTLNFCIFNFWVLKL